jgi:hypothetical protein
MEHAKRMVLVDEKLADHFFRKQDQNWKRPTEQLAKHNLSKEMRLGLNDESMPEDIRAKQYRQTLSRFLNMKRKLPDELLIDLNTTSSVDDLLGLSFEEKSKKKYPSFPMRHSKRKVKTPKNCFGKSGDGERLL